VPRPWPSYVPTILTSLLPTFSCLAMNGYEFVPTVLRADAAIAATPVNLSLQPCMTCDRPKTLARRTVGVTHFLPKPFESEMVPPRGGGSARSRFDLPPPLRCPGMSIATICVYITDTLRAEK